MDSRAAQNHLSCRSSMGSIAVDVLIAGGAAGMAMMAYLLPTAGESLAELLSRFSGMGMQPLLYWGIAHAIYGIMPGYLYRSGRS